MSYYLGQCSPSLEGYELLLRPVLPIRGDVKIVDIILIAEQRGLMDQLGLNIIELAFELIKKVELVNSHLFYTINLSTAQMDKLNLAEKINSLIRKHKIDTKNLTFEITETAIIKEKDRTLILLNNLKSLGLNIAIDDFGQGYSSLSRLKDLPADILKLDMTFTNTLVECKQTQIIVNALINLTQALNIKVVCEGVENSNQLN